MVKQQWTFIPTPFSVVLGQPHWFKLVQGRLVACKWSNREKSKAGASPWKHCDEARKLALLGTTATHDVAESTLGGCTAQIQRYGRIALSSAAAISDMNRNGFFHRKTKAKNDKKPRGMFHEFDDVLMHAIVEVAMQDAPETRERNNKDLEDQAQHRRLKEEMAREKNMEKATDEYIEALYLINMYASEACVKGDKRGVKRMLKKLKSKTAKYNAIKANITLRVKGFGWDWCKHAWSAGNKPYSVEVLAKWLEWIVSEERSRKLKIPTKPTPNVPQRKKTGQVGTATDEVAELDKQYMEDAGDFEKRATKMQQRREVTGESSMHSRMQPFVRPEVESLKGMRIDYLHEFGKKGEADYELCWCQGKVEEVCENPKKPNTVKVLWDAMANSDVYKDQTESTVDLLPTFWNKDKYRAWRMDINIVVLPESDNESDEESEDESESEPDSESEVEEEDEISD